MRLRLVLLLLLTLPAARPALAQAPTQVQAPTQAQAQAQGFVPGIDDLPLMPGLAAEAGAVVFDKPTGRIVEAGAEGPRLTAARVRDFYRRTLSGLGWQEVRVRGDKLMFVREGEELTLAITPLASGARGEAAPGVRVQFDVAPR